jgi:hypothetical protein
MSCGVVRGANRALSFVGTIGATRTIDVLGRRLSRDADCRKGGDDRSEARRAKGSKTSARDF